MAWHGAAWCHVAVLWLQHCAALEVVMHGVTAGGMAWHGVASRGVGLVMCDAACASMRKPMYKPAQPCASPCEPVQVCESPRTPAQACAKRTQGYMQIYASLRVLVQTYAILRKPMQARTSLRQGMVCNVRLRLVHANQTQDLLDSQSERTVGP